MQGGSEFADFDLGRLPVAPQIQRGLAVAFARRTAPGNGLTTLSTFKHTFYSVRAFACYLAAMPDPPQTMSDLAPEHIDGFTVARLNAGVEVCHDLGQVKALLRVADGVTDAVVAKAQERHPKRIRKTSKAGYTKAEFKRIVDAARADLRAAAARIRGNREVLQRYRAGDWGDTDPRELVLLDYVDQHADVPRRRMAPESVSSSYNSTLEPALGWVFHVGSIIDIISQLHLTGLEAFAGEVLLAAMTGQNASVILNTTVAHHRADGHTGQTPTAILDTVKPRRGRHAYMNLALSDVPDWITVPDHAGQMSARDELHTPFGVYALLAELTSRTREISGTNSIFVSYHATGGRAKGRGLRVSQPGNCLTTWARKHNLVSDRTDEDGNPIPLQIDMRRIRLTYLELHQKPVAHQETTLVNDYLTRNRASLVDYQRVVAKALTEEVDKARTRGVMTRLTGGDLARATRDPDTIAAEFGVNATMLKRMIARELDTVMAACTDDGTGPHSSPDGPCRASFMQCLGCSCARAMPHHLPVQILVHDQLEARKAEMTPLAWTQRYGLPHAQLADLLGEHDDIDIADARAVIGDADRALVERFLNRELDLR
ncbi:hypothetical protein CRH09_39790 (plasmid) [Nocardia terpenica]|uniref:Uncharacterized protein n=1 Tax=Nocardia terpenica TaxID=455432 RepID=A0A291RQB8_9NOCA|nr:hypothetical protein CRH09_27910 [Nocardia terpenica]ATL72516.1 hypothetical protein CRH09_39790 [Nocardia terpenica]